MKYKISETFSEVLPALNDEEYAKLEESIKKHGVQTPLTTWKEYIIDGHHRHTIAEEYKIKITLPPIIMDDELEDEDDVIVWMIDNQKGRRNLNDIELAELYKIKYVILTRKGKEKMSEAGKEGGKTAGKGRPKNDRGMAENAKPLKEEINTRQSIADELGWGTNKTAKALYILKHATLEEMELFKEKGNSIGGAHKIVKARIDAEEEAKKSKPKVELTEEEILEKQINGIIKKVEKINTNAETLYTKVFDVLATMNDMGIDTLDSTLIKIEIVGSFRNLYRSVANLLQRFGLAAENGTETNLKKLENHD